ncbi:flagellar hook-length control protein FliK [Pseudaestuariivita rosea]|uniref:flagellar hook-length control protein FliK n=1 Tax=Pseudaestuariivita rosea TaxID=2763263 RepID=UPI001ABA5389|nr:flagellar hook-length control protein FliK [Pseudaestuariivita rosea]
MFTFITTNTPQLGLLSGDGQSIEPSLTAGDSLQFQDVLKKLASKEAIDSKIEIPQEENALVRSDADTIEVEADEAAPQVPADQIEKTFDQKPTSDDTDVQFQLPVADSKKTDPQPFDVVMQEYNPVEKVSLEAKVENSPILMTNNIVQTQQSIDVNAIRPVSDQGFFPPTDAKFEAKPTENIGITKQVDLAPATDPKPVVEAVRVLPPSTNAVETTIGSGGLALDGDPASAIPLQPGLKDNSVVPQMMPRQTAEPMPIASGKPQSFQFADRYAKITDRDSRFSDVTELRKADVGKGKVPDRFVASNEPAQPTVQAQPTMAELEQKPLLQNDVAEGSKKDMIVSVTTTELSQTSGSRGAEAKVAQAELPRYVAAQMSDAIKANPRDNVIDLQLSPEELGRVRMTVNANETAITMVVQAERPETLELLRRNIETLGQQFERLGYSDVSFDFGSGQNASSDQGTQNKGTAEDYGHEHIEDTQILTIKTEGLDLRL